MLSLTLPSPRHATFPEILKLLKKTAILGEIKIYAILTVLIKPK